MNWDQYEVLTFDCYGTLIDWETGILRAARTVMARHGVDAQDDAILEAFAREESRVESGEYRSYHDVLVDVMAALGREFGFESVGAERVALAESVGEWPPFADSDASLRALASRYRLGILSNIDDALLERSLRHFSVEFDFLVTAQEVRSYKPAEAHFHRGLECAEEPMDRVLHVAQSLFHDIQPANALGLDTVWVNRRRGQPGSGATPPATATPLIEVGSMAELAEHAA